MAKEEEKERKSLLDEVKEKIGEGYTKVDTFLVEREKKEEDREKKQKLGMGVVVDKFEGVSTKVAGFVGSVGAIISPEFLALPSVVSMMFGFVKNIFSTLATWIKGFGRFLVKAVIFPFKVALKLALLPLKVVDFMVRTIAKVIDKIVLPVILKVKDFFVLTFKGLVGFVKMLPWLILLGAALFIFLPKIEGFVKNVGAWTSGFWKTFPEKAEKVWFDWEKKLQDTPFGDFMVWAREDAVPWIKKYWEKFAKGTKEFFSETVWKEWLRPTLVSIFGEKNLEEIFDFLQNEMIRLINMLKGIISFYEATSERAYEFWSGYRVVGGLLAGEPIDVGRARAMIERFGTEKELRGEFERWWKVHRGKLPTEEEFEKLFRVHRDRLLKQAELYIGPKPSWAPWILLPPEGAEGITAEEIEKLMYPGLEYPIPQRLEELNKAFRDHNLMEQRENEAFKKTLEEMERTIKEGQKMQPSGRILNQIQNIRGDTELVKLELLSTGVSMV